jgi:hypothetical protein
MTYNKEIFVAGKHAFLELTRIIASLSIQPRSNLFFLPCGHFLILSGTHAMYDPHFSEHRSITERETDHENRDS